MIGLGNPGLEYQHTRHNIGFVVVEQLARAYASQQNLAELWKMESKHHAEVCRVGNVLFVKPQTYMNDSGRAVRSLLAFFDKQQLAEPSAERQLHNVMVIFDDLDIPLGSYKLQFGKGPKVHNGLSSLYAELQTSQFWHVRVGVDGRAGARTVSGADYVLGRFSPAEQLTVSQLMPTVLQNVLAQVAQGKDAP